MSLKGIEWHAVNLICLCHDVDYGNGLSDSIKSIEFLV
jgi:hypothetical protein